MKKPLAFSILFFTVITLFANPIIIDLSDVYLNGKMYEQDFFIEEVIDARSEKYCLGFVHKGMANNKKPAYFQQSLEQELHGFFAKTFKKGDGKESISIRVNHLFIYEVIYSDREYAYAELNLSFLKKNKNHYIELLEVGTSAEKIGMDVTKHHPTNIVNAIGGCFKEFNEKRKKGQLQNKEIALSDIGEYSLRAKDYPVFNSPSASKGIYKTFNDFRQNKPRSITDFDLDYYRDEDINLIAADLYWDKNTPKEERKIWGINDGENDFIRIGKSFYKITKKEDEFQVVAPLVKNNNGVLIGAALGGVIGGVVGGLMDGSFVKYDEYRIDFVTGNILPLKEPLYRKIESRLYLCSSRYSKKEMVLKIDGKEKCKLLSGEYMKLSFAPETTSVELCVASENGETCETLLLEVFKRKTYLLSGYKKKWPKIDLPNKNLLVELEHEIRNGKFVQVCDK